MSNQPQQQGDAALTAAETDGHQDVGNQNEVIPEPQLDPASIDVSDVVEQDPAGGDDGANA